MTGLQNKTSNIEGLQRDIVHQSTPVPSSSVTFLKTTLALPLVKLHSVYKIYPLTEDSKSLFIVLVQKNPAA